MKRILVISLLCTLSGLLEAATPLERIYVSTDRSIYIAGDAVWCSLFSLNGNSRFSNESAVAYLELASSDGTVCTAKIGLLEGRGAGSFRIPVTTPTGTYRLLAYTAVNAAEEGQPWLAGSRLINIFNTTSSARVVDGIDILEPAAYEALEKPESDRVGDIQLSSRIRVPRGASTVLNIHNPGKKASVSLSVFHEDDLIPVQQEHTPESFLKRLPSSVSLQRDVLPEYDGEIVSARIRGSLMAEEEDVAFATLSTAGSPSDIYFGQAVGSDLIRFYTSNIYGDREIVCEVKRLDRKEGYIDFESPFLYPQTGPLPRLAISSSQRESLVARKAALRSEKALRIDTLTTFMAHREDLLLSSVSHHRYHLDDYARFPSVQDIIVEILPEVQVRKTRDGRWALSLTVGDALQSRYDRTEHILVMMDGVVLSDLDPLMDFDAMLLEDIDIYDQTFLCGRTPFHGIVNFISKKNYVTALHFPSNVRVHDFQGVAYPVAYGGAVPSGEGPDLRQVLYWHPVLELDEGSDYRLVITAPGYSGRFKAVAEGFTEDGTPVYQAFSFEVE